MSTVSWNPWHGCTKISPGCKYCYVYRIDANHGAVQRAMECKKTGDFNLPIKKTRNKEYKVPAGSFVYTCFTSDFFLEDADAWRDECWDMIRRRSDCNFCFFTKRIDRFMDCIPEDWGSGYENVYIGCTVENQEMADKRLPVFLDLPIRHKSIIIAPMIGPVNIEKYLDDSIEEVGCSGESGNEARICKFDWILDVRRSCMEKDVSFSFHQTGARLEKDGKVYQIPRRLQHSQAHKAGIDYKAFRRYSRALRSLNSPLEADEGARQISIFDTL